ncbi:MAG: phosphatase PAP2 family protein [Bacteroidetes bacterium]|nr:phosphatase PAP2 family protein [Bacteroidota bacterium]
MLKNVKPLFLNLLLRKDVLAFIGCIAFYFIFPKFDLTVTSLFYSDEHAEFIWRKSVLAVAVYELTRYLAVSLFFSLLLAVIAVLVFKIDYLVQKKRQLLFLFLVLVVGPGLVVNTGFKENWDRPRPRETIQFGGENEFEPPFSPTFNCNDCFSFVSGHASVGFYFFSVVLLLNKRRWLWVPVLAGGGIGFVRMVQGGHYLSDVMFSGWFVWFVCVILYSLFFPDKKET